MAAGRLWRMRPPPPITSRTNARVKALRAAFSGRAARPGEVVGIEGKTLIDEARRSGMIFDTLLVRQGAESLLVTYASLGASHILVLSPDVFGSVVDTMSPQGIAATVTIPATADEADDGQPGTVLVLENVQDPGNVGTLIRSAEAFGVQAVYLTDRSANAWSPKVIRASAGSVFRARMRREPITAALLGLKRAGRQLVGAVVQSDAAVSSMEAVFQAAVALVIGNEGAGLSEEALSLVDVRVHIPCRTESLNAAVAGSLLLYEVQRQKDDAANGGDA